MERKITLRVFNSHKAIEKVKAFQTGGCIKRKCTYARLIYVILGGELWPGALTIRGNIQIQIFINTLKVLNGAC